MFLPLHIPAISVWRDTACSFEDFSIKGGICTAHGGRFFYNTKPLQTLIKTRVGCLFVKYVSEKSKNYEGRIMKSEEQQRAETMAWEIMGKPGEPRKNTARRSRNRIRICPQKLPRQTGPGPWCAFWPNRRVGPWGLG